VAVLDELRASVAESPAWFGEATISLRISVGVCCVVPNEDDSMASLLERADAALYQAKGQGRNTLCLAPSNVHHGKPNCVNVVEH
jgi:diguanylate cyclase (GGDEF)-like protein